MTLLHQKFRRKDEQGRLISDYSDYAIVYQLLEESFAESLGDVKRYTDDRIRLIENVGMMTPRDFAEKVGISTAAISQWSKGMIEKGLLIWCDERGSSFGGDLALEKAKREGKAFLYVANQKILPSPFQLTDDSRWNKGGDLWTAYDLALDDPVGDNDLAFTTTENVISDAVGENDAVDFGDASENGTTAVKVLSGKTDDEIKKMLESLRDNQSNIRICLSYYPHYFNSIYRELRVP